MANKHVKMLAIINDPQMQTKRMTKKNAHEINSFKLRVFRLGKGTTGGHVN